jgi:hypothetical protein
MPGQSNLSAGTILLGETGDSATRPAWAKDGSFLVFRQLKQLVPEFDKFLTDNAIVQDGLTPQQGSDLLGARMVGRWKSVRHSLILRSSLHRSLFCRVPPSILLLSSTTRCLAPTRPVTTTSRSSTPMPFSRQTKPGTLSTSVF